MGAHASSMTISVQTEAERLKVPLVTTSYADLIVQRGFTYTFKLPPLASEFSRAGIDYMKEIAQASGKPLKKVAMFYGSDAASKATGTAFLPLLEKSGLEIVAKGTFQSGMTDATPILTQVKSSQPDLVYIYGYVSDLILTIRGLRSIGMNIPVVSSGGPVTTKAIVESLGKTANGLFGTVMWNGDLNYPGVKEFTKAYLAKYSDERFVIAEAGEGYVCGWLIKEAMERAGSAEPTKIRDALAKMEISQGPAAMMPPGKVAFGPNGLSKYTFPIMIEWINEEPRTVWPVNVQTLKPLF
jgi:branched-chain amino acid transport system substrate-binding protein